MRRRSRSGLGSFRSIDPPVQLSVRRPIRAHHHPFHQGHGREKAQHHAAPSRGPQGRLDRPRRPGGRHRPTTRRRCGAEGRQRSPRHRHEPCSGGLPPLPERHDPRPGRRRLAGPRPVRPVCRPLEPDAVRPALPLGLRPRAGRPEVVAHVGIPDPRPPRGAPHHRHRDHHRTTRLRHGVRGRHGHGAASPARTARPRRQDRRQPLRPPHLGHRLRRRPDGGRERRGQLARRSPGARQPHHDLRRQPDLDRGPDRHLVLRGRRRALPRLRLGRRRRRLARRR